MSQSFADIAFTPSVREVQESMGSRKYYARQEARSESPVELTAQEAEFIGSRDSFYMATVSETGWPYVQYRGGPPGFLKVLSSRSIGFADYRGNRQYVSVGNLLKDTRVALILVDYPHQLRLKILGSARLIAADDQPTLALLQDTTYRAKVERGIVIDVAAYDWNCPQHITPRFTVAEVESIVKPLQRRIAQLEAQAQKAPR